MTLHEEVVKLETYAHHAEYYTSRIAQIHFHTQWIYQGNDAYKFNFDFLYWKVETKLVLSLYCVMDPMGIKGMFFTFSHNIFFHYELMDGVVFARYSYCRVLTHKVFCGNKDLLDEDLYLEELYVVFCSM